MKPATDKPNSDERSAPPGPPARDGRHRQGTSRHHGRHAEAELGQPREKLEALVRQRTFQLEVANAELHREIADRKCAEAALRAARDELERKIEERTQDLQRTNRILLMTSECGQALVQVASEQEFIRTICRITTDIGGYLMAWVGIAEHDRAKTVRPIMAVGFEDDYLEKAKITWADKPRGRGPTGTAIRTGKVCIGSDFLSDPKLAPWRELALRRGFRSSIALPLRVGGCSFGALTVYAAKPVAFDQEQTKLLSDLADDLSFGIGVLRARAERDRVRKDLEKNSTQLRALTAELARAEQRERRRIAQVLHDRLQQLLVGARYGVETLRAQMPAAAARKAIQRVDGLLGQCLETTRSLTLELSPPILYEAGLPAALKWLGRWFRETHGLSVIVITREHSLPDTEDLRIVLFQATRELLFNVVKHARVKQAVLCLSRLPGDRLKLTVSDRGVGFDLKGLEAKKGKKGGFGLFSVGERLGLLGGQLHIESALGRGSQFTLIVPLPSAAAAPTDRPTAVPHS
jgi:signal transduction histidine kinase